MVFSAILALIVVLANSIYTFFKHRHGYWSRKNVPTPPTSIPLGNLKSLRRQEHPATGMAKFYHEMKGKGPFCGLYFFHSPRILAIDPTFIKNILIKDFNSFEDRVMYYNERDDPLSAHLVTVDGGRWKSLRAKLTPTFTSAKMKFMYPKIIKVADRFQQCITKRLEQGDELEMKELLARFTTDVIGTCAQFRAMGKKFFVQPRNSAFKQLFVYTFKRLALSLRMVVTQDDVTEFFMGIVRETIELREKNNIHRKDFLDLLIEIKNKGSLDGTAVGKVTFNEIAAHVFVFFLAGFETLSTTMFFAIYELTLNKDIQTRAREEIKAVLDKHDGELSYEAMMEMPYLDNIIKETLRKYPPASNILRMSTKAYHVPEFKVTIDPGTLITISAYGIHHDPQYYPDPEKFDPDRFAPEVANTRPSCTYLPFGNGPRNCIGMRFAMMQTRIGLVTLLRNFEFNLSPKTPVPLMFDPMNFIMTIKGVLYLKLNKIVT